MLNHNPSPRFGNTKSALQHLTHHVLTPPESHAWHLIWEDRFASLGDEPAALKWCAMQREALASIFQNNAAAEGIATPEPLAPLLQSYLQTIQTQVKNAARLGWTVKLRDQSAGFDTHGIFSATVDVSGSTIIKTAYLPGFGSSEATRQSQAIPSDPHARSRIASKMRGRDREQRTGARRPGITSRLAERRSGKWSSEEKLYYLVFRPAVQSLRRWQPGLNREVRPNLQDLKSVLPRMSELKLEHWKALRQEVSV